MIHTPLLKTYKMQSRKYQRETYMWPGVTVLVAMVSYSRVVIGMNNNEGYRIYHWRNTVLIL